MHSFAFHCKRGRCRIQHRNGYTQKRVALGYAPECRFDVQCPCDMGKSSQMFRIIANIGSIGKYSEGLRWSGANSEFGVKLMLATHELTPF